MAGFLISAVVLILHHGQFEGIEFFYGNDFGLYIHKSWWLAWLNIGFSVSYIVLSLIMGRRSFCHSFCIISVPMHLGLKVRKALSLPGLRLKAERKHCNKCGVCSRVCSMNLDVKTMVNTDDINNESCILCGECVDSCKTQVIKYTFSKHY